MQTPLPGRRFETIVVASDRGLAEADEIDSLVAELRAGGVAVEWLHGADPASGSVEATLRELGARGIAECEVLVVADLVDPVFADRTATVVDGSSATLCAVLRDQLRRRAVGGDLPAAGDDPLWTIAIDGVDPQRERAADTVLTLGDGRFGTSGSPLVAHPSADARTLAGGVYVNDGPETALLACPVWTQLAGSLEAPTSLRRTLDLRHGLLRHEWLDDVGPVRALAFASLRRPGTMVLRATGPRALLSSPSPLRGHDCGDAPTTPALVAGAHGGVAVAAADDVQPLNAEQVRLDRIACYVADAGTVPEPAAAAARLGDARRRGFDVLLAEQRAAWTERWADADIRIEGDPELQRAVRFCLFGLMASAPDEGEAAIGARGISGAGYRGHVFWDTDVFVLPFLAATRPAAARAVLEYRLRRLPQALAAARRLRRRGARFPWESAGEGVDVTPPFARDRTGRMIPIRTGQHEEHIVADVAWGASTYVDWSGDEAFAGGPGLELLVETARYWASRIRLDVHGQGHIYDVIGPDEYHEPVDDSAFTNVMARWNLRRAARQAAGRVDAGEVRSWHDLAEALVDGYDPATGLYEEFAGFFRLEPLVIADLARRPVAAPLLLGEERTAGAQVVKQADVVMLHHLVPGEVAPGSLEPNLRFYEPRTSHGSSLSPAIHASLFARAGMLPEAVDWLRQSSRIDLDDIGHSTAGGLHLATMGGVWQALVMGFGGIRPVDDGLALDPRLPADWESLEIRLRLGASRVRVRIEHDALEVAAEPGIPIAVTGRPGRVAATPAGIRLARERTW